MNEFPQKVVKAAVKAFQEETGGFGYQDDKDAVLCVLRAAVLSGFRLVPVEPTDEILSQLSDNRHDAEPGGKANWSHSWSELLNVASGVQSRGFSRTRGKA